MVYTTLSSLLTAIANAIRSKTGETNTINAQDFPSKILSILQGSGNAKPSDVLSGKTFSNDNGGATGTMPSRTNGTKTLASGKDNNGIWFYIPYGYYPEYSNGKAWIASDPSQYGNADASDVLSGKTFTSNNGLAIVGTLEKGLTPTGGIAHATSGATTSTTVNSKVLCVSGSYSAWDLPALSVQIKVNDSWIVCNSSNGTVAEDFAYGAANGRRNRILLWYNNGPYKNSIIQEIWAGTVDNDAAISIAAIKY